MVDPSLASPETLRLALADPAYGRPFGRTNYSYHRAGIKHQGVPSTVVANQTAGSLLISRTDIMACAHSWVQDRVPYCQCSGGPASECCGSCPHCDTTR